MVDFWVVPYLTHAWFSEQMSFFEEKKLLLKYLFRDSEIWHVCKKYVLYACSVCSMYIKEKFSVAIIYLINRVQQIIPSGPKKILRIEKRGEI